MAEKPILFSTPMVQSIQKDIKSKTRRIAKGVPPNTHRIEQISENEFEAFYGFMSGFGMFIDGSTIVKCQYKVGDILWVRETWCNINKPEYEPEFYYLAGCLQPWVEDYMPSEWKWKPSIHMPRKAARLFLKVTNVWLERLQDITEEDARAEGIEWTKEGPLHAHYHDHKLEAWLNFPTAKEAFRSLWDSLNESRGYGWNINPYVWVIEFERIDPEGR